MTEIDSLKSLPGYTSDQGLWNPGHRKKCRNQPLPKHINAAKTSDAAPFKITADERKHEERPRVDLRILHR